MKGSIRNRSRGSWQIRIFLGRNDQGKTQHYTETIRGKKSDAEHRMIELLHKYQIGALKMPTSMTLSAYLKNWLEQSLKGTVSPRTYSDYSELVTRYIDKEIGKIKLNKLEPIHIQSFYNKLIERNLSPRTVKYVHMVLRRALRQAERWGMVMRNVATLVDPPKQQRRKLPRALDFDQAAKFLEAASFDRYYALWVLALDTGMRPEEYLGLNWRDVNLNARTINIHQALCWNRDGGGYYFSDLKTPESRRVISIAPGTVEVLHEWSQKQAAWKASRERWPEPDLVFTTMHGQPIHPSNLQRRHFKPTLERAKLPLSFRVYDLRHTCASLLGALGHRAKEVQERLGHSSSKTTLDFYSHVLPSERDRPAESMQRTLMQHLRPAVK